MIAIEYNDIYMKSMNCILTGEDVEYENDKNYIYYTLKIGENQVEIFICRNCLSNIKLNVPFCIIKGLIANDKWPKRSLIISENHQNGPTQDSEPVNCETIIFPSFLKTANYPKSPAEKMNNLFINLFKLQKIDGETITIDLFQDNFYEKNYFNNLEELKFYINGIKENGLIKVAYSTPSSNIHITFTLLGLNKVVELLDEGNISNNCFIAMSFNEEMKPFRDAIKKALNSTGYKPVIIDEEHLASDKTIPDGILSGIKRSKFCIADFTKHRNGVYFESGYALGLGKPVIYLCEKKQFKKAHFDIKQLQHIIYSTPDELEKRLIEKIEAWIQ